MEHSKFVNMVTEAISKLETQGELSKADRSNLCSYQMNKGSKQLCCIVGFMMPADSVRLAAEEFNTNGDGTSISSLFEHDFHWAKNFTEKQIGMLAELQNIHDNLHGLRTFDEIINKMHSRVEDYVIYLR